MGLEVITEKYFISIIKYFIKSILSFYHLTVLKHFQGKWLVSSLELPGTQFQLASPSHVMVEHVLYLE